MKALQRSCFRRMSHLWTVLNANSKPTEHVFSFPMQKGFLYCKSLKGTVAKKETLCSMLQVITVIKKNIFVTKKVYNNITHPRGGNTFIYIYIYIYISNYPLFLTEHTCSVKLAFKEIRLYRYNKKCGGSKACEVENRRHSCTASSH